MVEKEEELEINIVDAPETKVDTDDELDTYTKNVSKRINNLNARKKQADDRAAMAEQRLAEREADFKRLQEENKNLATRNLAAEENAVQAKESQADELYKKAVTSGDAELLSKADTLKSDLAIQKEKIRIAKSRQEQPEAVESQPDNGMSPQELQEFQQFQQLKRQQEQLNPEDVAWAQKNTWIYDEKYTYASDYAKKDLHPELVEEGFVPSSREYYDEVDKRMKKVHPELYEGVKNEGGPTVQRVASTSPGSRLKTQAKKGSVTLTKQEIARVASMKPVDMSEENWLKRLATEKQKIQNRNEVR